MSTLIDSAAHFEGRLQGLGLTPVVINAIKTHGVSTLSQLAFALGQPGQPSADDTIGAFLRGALTRPAALNETAAIKRAAFEAQTYLRATLRQNVERGDEAPHKIAFAERASRTRMEALRAAVVGVSITGEHDPAHCLLDKACQMYKSNTLKQLDLASCVSRTLEVQGATKNRELAFEKGSLVLKNQDDKLISATDSEIKVHYAMIRRGLAFQFARLMSHEQHCQWETFLFESLHCETPPGYSRPTLAQLIQCDKAAFGGLSSTLQNIRQAADGSYPLGIALLNLRTDPNITLFLAPLAKGPAPTNPGGLGVRANPYDGGGHGKGKGKGKGKRSSPLQFPKSFVASGIRCPMEILSVLASIASPVATQKSRQARNVQRAGMFALSPSARRITVWHSMVDQIRDRQKHPLHSSLGMVYMSSRLS